MVQTTQTATSAVVSASAKTIRLQRFRQPEHQRRGDDGFETHRDVDAQHDREDQRDEHHQRVAIHADRHRDRDRADDRQRDRRTDEERIRPRDRHPRSRLGRLVEREPESGDEENDRERSAQRVTSAGGSPADRRRDAVSRIGKNNTP